MTILQTIERRFNFVVILTLFFPIILQALYQEDVESYGPTALSWGILVSVVVLNFLLMEIVLKDVSKFELTSISWLLLGNIFLYVPALMIIGFFPRPPKYLGYLLLCYRLFFGVSLLYLRYYSFYFSPDSYIKRHVNY